MSMEYLFLHPLGVYLYSIHHNIKIMHTVFLAQPFRLWSKITHNCCSGNITSWAARLSCRAEVGHDGSPGLP